MHCAEITLEFRSTQRSCLHLRSGKGLDSRLLSALRRGVSTLTQIAFRCGRQQRRNVIFAGVLRLRPEQFAWWPIGLDVSVEAF